MYTLFLTFYPALFSCPYVVVVAHFNICHILLLQSFNYNFNIFLF